MLQWRHTLLWLLSLLPALLLTGCMFQSSFDELYEVPRLPNEYTALREQIDDILSNGAEYAAPTSGTNIQSVQLVDLDGDGVEEALAFFRNSNEEKPLKIYIFQAVDDTYEQVALVEGNGTSIHSISYVDMDNDGIQELIIGWRFNTEDQALGVYSLRGFEPKLLLEGLYTQYETLDFDGDGLQEIVLLHRDTEGELIAEYYDWKDQLLQSHSVARLSMTLAELDRMDTGYLRGGEIALFVTGVAEDTRAITDILTYYQDAITNIVRNDVTGVSSEIFRYINLQPQDIDGDGVTEVPMPVQLPSSSGAEEELYWQVIWRNYNTKGQGEVALTTYHNNDDGWYLVLPEEWDSLIAVRPSYVTADERGVIFSVIGLKEGEFQDFLEIYTITGSSREIQATRNNRFVLKRQMDTIYAAAFLEGNSGWQYAIDQEELNQRFRLIVPEWDPGEN